MFMLVSDLLEYRSYITDNTVIYIRRNGRQRFEGYRSDESILQYQHFAVADFFFNPAVGVDSIFIILK